MKITPNTRAIILSGIRNKGIKNIDLTRHLNKPKNWTTKLFNGTLKTLSEEDIDNICDYLEVSFLKVTETGSAVNPVAVKLSKLMDSDDSLASSLSLLTDFIEDLGKSGSHTLPYIPTEDLVAFGEEMVRAAHEDPGKPGKVGRIGVVMMAEILDKLNAPQEECACDTLPMRGCVAAGSPVYVDDVDETVCVSKEYPEGAYALQVCGSSQDDGTDRAILDGSTIVVVPTGEFYTPKEGELYIVSDGNGSTLKEIKGKKLVSRNPKHKDFSPLEDARIQAKFIEVLES